MLHELPSGTVTFLFTDIEGSTRLVEALGSGYVDVLAEHRRLIRDAVARRGGVEFGTQGDAIFFAFSDADDTLVAAEEAQHALASSRTRVRMAIHTGNPLLTDEGYAGIDVHRVARICSAGHGGQVLVSEATRKVVSRNLRPLGAHRLKDLGRPEALYQLGDGEFPPLTSLNQSTLPTLATPFLGRERELADVLAILRRDDVRVLTLTGLGGTGKTRLALQAAAEQVEHSPHGVWWVPLQMLRDARLVVPTIASALGIVGDIADELAGKHLLLLLDNVEHVLDAVPELAELLQIAPGVTVLATSREPLGLAGEHVFAVPRLEERQAVELFTERARAVVVGFESDAVVAEICERLDGVPLAIELAAARVSSIAPEALLRRLEKRLPLLTSGPRDAPERQRTLRATIDWSYDLLDETERTLFARVAVFAGGCTLETAEQVCDAELETLHSLVSKSLLVHGDGRYTMLETIREYALERLDASGDGHRWRMRHAEHFLEVALAECKKFVEGHQVESLAVLDAELTNVRAALAWTLDDDANTVSVLVGLRIARAMGRYWYTRAHLLDGSAWLERALAADQGENPEERGEALRWLGILADERGDVATAEEALRESSELARATGDRAQLARSLLSLGVVTRNAGDAAHAHELLTESLEIRRDLADRAGLSVPLTNLALVALDAGDTERASILLAESLALDREFESTDGIAVNLLNLGWVALRVDESEQARPLLGEALRAFDELGDPDGTAECIEAVAVLAVSANHVLQAARLAGAAHALRELYSTPRAPDVQARLDSDLAPARDKLGVPAFADAFAAGRDLTHDAAVAAAHDELSARSAADA
ncbi:MAG: tetratricopeptide repeat protein [Actinomycetota bacterium]|nr:tetratricopeptide repeat protein [Actinomycetota bacterium]